MSSKSHVSNKTNVATSSERSRSRNKYLKRKIHEEKLVNDNEKERKEDRQNYFKNGYRQRKSNNQSNYSKFYINRAKFNFIINHIQKNKKKKK